METRLLHLAFRPKRTEAQKQSLAQDYLAGSVPKILSFKTCCFCGIKRDKQYMAVKMPMSGCAALRGVSIGSIPFPAFQKVLLQPRSR